MVFEWTKLVSVLSGEIGHISSKTLWACRWLLVTFGPNQQFKGNSTKYQPSLCKSLTLKKEILKKRLKKKQMINSIQTVMRFTFYIQIKFNWKLKMYILSNCQIKRSFFPWLFYHKQLVIIIWNKSQGMMQDCMMMWCSWSSLYAWMVQSLFSHTMRSIRIEANSNKAILLTFTVSPAPALATLSTILPIDEEVIIGSPCSIVART